MTRLAARRGHSPALVLLHGWGLNSAIWAPLARRLEHRFRLVLIDLPGHGHSPATAPASLKGWADAVAAAAPPGSTWLGWSLGGQVALTAALNGHAIHRLILVSTTPRFLAAPDWPCGLPSDVLQAFGISLSHNHRKTVNDFISVQLRGDKRAATILQTLRALLADNPLPDPGALATGLEILAQTDLRSRLPVIQVPALVLAGERDRLTPVEASRRLASFLPRGRFQSFPGASHAPFLSHEDAFVQALESFLPNEAAIT